MCLTPAMTGLLTSCSPPDESCLPCQTQQQLVYQRYRLTTPMSALKLFEMRRLIPLVRSLQTLHLHPQRPSRAIDRCTNQVVRPQRARRAPVDSPGATLLQSDALVGDGTKVFQQQQQAYSPPRLHVATQAAACRRDLQQTYVGLHKHF